MKVYIVTEYDRYEDEVIGHKVYTEQALKRRKDDLIEQARLKKEEEIEEENKRYNKTTTERELLGSEIDKLNKAVKEAKDNGDEAQYRFLHKERRKICRRFDGITREHSNNIWKIERKYEYKVKSIMERPDFDDETIVEKVELVL